MPLHIDESWEYWLPDPEIEYVMGCNGDTRDCAMSEFLDFRTRDSRGAAWGARFGRGNPDFCRTHLAPPKIEKYRETIGRGVCDTCGYSFQVKHKGQRYCNWKCSGRTILARDLLQLACPCGVLFYTRNPKRKVCGRDCSKYCHPGAKKRIDRKRFKELWLSGLKEVEVARQLGIDRSSCNNIRKELGLPRKGKAPLSKEGQQRIIEMRAAGVTVKNIAKEVGIHIVNVFAWLKKQKTTVATDGANR